MNPKWLVPVLFVGLILVLCVGLASGPVKIPPGIIKELIFSTLNTGGGKKTGVSAAGYGFILFQIRAPRLVLNLVTGAALAGSGAVFQGVLRNKLADPYLIGLSSGAALGATAAMAYRPLGADRNFWLVPLLAFSGALLALFTVYRIAGGKKHASPPTLILGGVAVSLTLSAISSLIMVVSGRELHNIVFWLMGGFSSAAWFQVYAVTPFILLGLTVCLFFKDELNMFSLGEERAMQLGVDVPKVKIRLLAGASVAVAGAVSVSGLIGFAGLIVPHLVRLAGGEDYRILLPASILCGALLITLSDTLARTVMAPLEIPVGIITAMAGGPFFIWLLAKKKEAA